MTESQIEKAVCKHAESKGFISYKFVSPNTRGVPDRLFIDNCGLVFFIEFKKPGGRIGPHQKREIDKIIGNNAKVFIVDTIVDGVKVINSYVD